MNYEKHFQSLHAKKKKKKLAKIQLVKLKHTYSKINEYIEQYRAVQVFIY